MKRWMSILLCLCMALAMAACANGGDSQTTEPAKEDAFRVGYSKVNLTPSYPLKLEGYGATGGGERLHEEVLDYIYLTCVAITDEKDNTVLMYAGDVIGVKSATAETVSAAVAKAAGVPKGNVFINASHSHSTSYADGLGNAFNKAAVQAAEEAMADRKPAQMFFGTADTSGISFIRHYFNSEGESVTDNHGDPNSELVSHTTELDTQMRILRFKREGGKDVILANWQCHPHLVSGANNIRNVLTADIVGMMRMYMEQDLDCLFAYYQGGAGNINPVSRISGEEAYEDRDYKFWGQSMANAAKMALQNMTEVPTGEIKVLNETFTCDANKEDLDKADEAAMVLGYHFEVEGGRSSAETKAYAETLGIASYYHASSIANRGSTESTFDIQINTVSIGDSFAWSTTEGEFFDATMKYVRDNSPYTYNFATPYTNGIPGYFPTLAAWEYGCYESDTSPAARGTAEKVADRLLEMLNTLHGE